MADPTHATYAKIRDIVTGEVASVRRSDGALIPADPANTDWRAYQAWLKAGNVPAEPAPQGATSA